MIDGTPFSSSLAKEVLFGSTEKESLELKEQLEFFGYSAMLLYAPKLKLRLGLSALDDIDTSLGCAKSLLGEALNFMGEGPCPLVADRPP